MFGFALNLTDFCGMIFMESSWVSRPDNGQIITVEDFPFSSFGL